MEEVDQVKVVLSASTTPLTIPEIVAQTGLTERDVDRILWSSPADFIWQPGHKWSLGVVKRRPDRRSPSTKDTRSKPLLAGMSKELRAFTLASGVALTVRRRPLDSDAFISVRSNGNSVELLINTAHELFTMLPVPFDEGEDETGYKIVAETLLAAWALYEDGMPVGPAKRSAEDTRLLWGRRAIEILRDTE